MTWYDYLHSVFIMTTTLKVSASAHGYYSSQSFRSKDLGRKQVHNSIIHRQTQVNQVKVFIAHLVRKRLHF
jgi:hypothetical protein